MPADCYILGLVIKSPQNKTHVVLVAGYVKWIKTVWSTGRSCKFFCSLPVDVFYVVWFMCLTLQRKEPVRSVNQVLFLWRVTLLNSNSFPKILSRGQLSSWVMRQRGRKLQNYGAFFRVKKSAWLRHQIAKYIVILRGYFQLVALLICCLAMKSFRCVMTLYWS